MKVVLLSHFWHPIAEPFVGGTEAFLSRFASALLQQGIEVICYVCEGSSIPGVEIRTLGVSREALAFPPALDKMSGEARIALRDYEDAVMWAAINDACSDPSIDIIHNNSFSAMPFYLSTLIQKPILHTLHLPPVIPTMAGAVRFCHEHGRVLQLVAGSQAHAQSWQAYYPVRQIISYRFDTETLPPYNLQEMAAAVPRTNLLDRARCAIYAREQYSIVKSVEQYLTLFKSLLKDPLERGSSQI